MRGWRAKLVFTLVVFFAGFATAVYALSPAPEGNADGSEYKTVIDSLLKSEDFAGSFNSGIHKCIEFGKEGIERSARYIKQEIDKEIDKRQQQSG